MALIKKDKEYMNGKINEFIFYWIAGTIFVIFVLSFCFGDYYTEEIGFNYSCSEIKEMIILNNFPDREIKGDVYLDTFWASRLEWDVEYYLEEDFREYYLGNCSKL